MSKHRFFSVYLLKGRFESLDDIEKGDIIRGELRQVKGANLPRNTRLYLVDAEPKRAWWGNYFGIDEDLNQVTKSAVLFILVKPQCFALTLGYGRTRINDESYHYDFGRIVTLNSIDPNLLTSTEVLEPGIARRRTTQIPTASEITWFDIDQDEGLLKKLTGKPKKEHEEMFKQVTGSSQLRINTGVQPRELPEFCRQLGALYESKEYEDKLPGINSIVPTKDPATTKRLDNQLIEAISARDKSLQLAVPGIVDYTYIDSFKFSWRRDAQAHPDLRLSHFYQHLDDGKVDLQQRGGAKALKDLELHLTNQSGANVDRHSIRKCLVFDTVLDGETYYLSEGEWYKVDTDYVEKLNRELDKHYAKDVGLPKYPGGPEGDYNKRAEGEGRGFVCLDEKNISPSGRQKAEPCDLYAFRDGPVFVHVKIFRKARDLSHLFKQGEVSMDLLKFEEGAIERCRERIAARPPQPQMVCLPDRRNIEHAHVIFAIASIKGTGNRSDRMTLFSRIGMRASFKSLRRMGVKAGFCYI